MKNVYYSLTKLGFFQTPFGNKKHWQIVVYQKGTKLFKKKGTVIEKSNLIDISKVLIPKCWYIYIYYNMRIYIQPCFSYNYFCDSILHVLVRSSTISFVQLWSSKFCRITECNEDQKPIKKKEWSQVLQMVTQFLVWTNT